MQFKESFPILIAHRDVAAQSVAGVRLRQIQHEIERDGWKTIVVDTREDAGIVAGAHRGLAVIVFGAEAARGDAGALKEIVDQLKRVHERAPGLPIIALGESGVFRADQRGAARMSWKMQFAAGSMGPKVDAACRFVRATGKRAAIGELAELSRIIAGDAGTTITPQASGIEYAAR